MKLIAQQANEVKQQTTNEAVKTMMDNLLAFINKK